MYWNYVSLELRLRCYSAPIPFTASDRYFQHATRSSVSLVEWYYSAVLYPGIIWNGTMHGKQKFARPFHSSLGPSNHHGLTFIPACIINCMASKCRMKFLIHSKFQWCSRSSLFMDRGPLWGEFAGDRWIPPQTSGYSQSSWLWYKTPWRLCDIFLLVMYC